MNSKKFFAWCRIAVSRIKYLPDRDAVHKELYNHLEDRYELLTARGLDRNAAEDAALQAMGDAEALAPLLASVHRPFWPYAMLLTRCILIILALLTIKPLWSFIDSYYTNEPIYYSHYHPYDDTQHDLGQRLFYAEPGTSASSDGYTFTLTRAAHWHETIPVQNSTSVVDRDVLYFEIKVFNPLPWAEPTDAYQNFWAIDSLGNYYPSTIIDKARIHTYTAVVTAPDCAPIR